MPSQWILIWESFVAILANFGDTCMALEMPIQVVFSQKLLITFWASEWWREMISHVFPQPFLDAKTSTTTVTHQILLRNYFPISHLLQIFRVADLRLLQNQFFSRLFNQFFFPCWRFLFFYFLTANRFRPYCCPFVKVFGSLFTLHFIYGRKIQAKFYLIIYQSVY